MSCRKLILYSHESRSRDFGQEDCKEIKQQNEVNLIPELTNDKTNHKI